MVCVWVCLFGWVCVCLSVCQILFFQFLRQYDTWLSDISAVTPFLYHFNVCAEPNLKLKMRVQLMNAAGMEEAGIDGGGIFREFLSELLKAGFDPNRGFFKYTADRLLYPNPQASILVPDFCQHFFFLGRMLGKVGLWPFNLHFY